MFGCHFLFLTFVSVSFLLSCRSPASSLQSIVSMKSKRPVCLKPTLQRLSPRWVDQYPMCVGVRVDVGVSVAWWVWVWVCVWGVCKKAENFNLWPDLALTTKNGSRSDCWVFQLEKECRQKWKRLLAPVIRQRHQIKLWHFNQARAKRREKWALCKMTDQNWLVGRWDLCLNSAWCDIATWRTHRCNDPHKLVSTCIYLGTPALLHCLHKQHFWQLNFLFFL